MDKAMDNLGDVSLRKQMGELLPLAIPTVAQMASYTAMQFIDTWLLAKIGATEATAASNSGGFAFAIISLGMGVLFVVNTLVSQCYGQRNHSACGRYMWQGIWWSAVYSVLVLPFIPLVTFMYGRMGHEPALARLETVYFEIVVAASLIKLVATSLGQFLLAINRPNWVLISAVSGVAVNAVAAWAMVLGHLGSPKLGVVGAAWAQNIGVLVEMGVLIAFVLQKSVRERFGVLDWKWRWAEMRTLVRIGVPSGLQVVTEVLAWVLFGTWVLAVFGTAAMAANTYMIRYMTVAFMPCFGVGTAVTALVGRYIGMGRPDIAERRADLGFFVAGLYIAACGAFFILGRYWLIGWFTKDPELIRIGATLMIFAALYEIFDVMYIVYNGALRGAGDTFVPAVIVGTLCWLINVLGGYLTARFLPALGVVGPWSIAMVYGAITGVALLVRFRRGGWRRIHLEERARVDRVPGFDVLPVAKPTSAATGMDPTN